MEAFLQNLTQSDIWIALVGFITTNFATIVGMIIYAVKQGLKRGTSQEEFQKKCAEYVAEAKDEANKAIEDAKKLLQELQISINDALKQKTEEEKAEIAAQSLKLTQTINEAKKALSVDEILDA